MDRSGLALNRCDGYCRLCLSKSFKNLIGFAPRLMPFQLDRSQGFLFRHHFTDSNFENWPASLKRLSKDSVDAFSANMRSLASLAHTIQPSCCAPDTYRSPSAARLSV